MLNDYESFKNEIFRLTSINLNMYKERQMKRRIDALITKRKVSGYVEYVNMIKKEPMYYEEFVNYLTINVSEFFRNKEQWSILENDILPYLFDSFGKKLKIWSAACSTGEEPYSLAMMLSKYLPLEQIEILATDIDKQVLARASEGQYLAKNISSVDKVYVDKFFDKIDNNVYQVKDKLKKCIKYEHHNLLLDKYKEDVNLIVCRNVLIYFTEEAKNDIYIKFNKSLTKGGIMFVGSTEQIIQAQEIGYGTVKSFFYKKV